MTVSPEITLGNVIQIVLLVAAIAGLYGKFTSVETKVNMMYGWWMRVVNSNGGMHFSAKEIHEAKDGD